MAGSPLSKVCETPPYLAGWQFTRATNAVVTLRGPSGAQRVFTDLIAGYGAVNFGHCNPAINPFGRLEADIMPGVYAPEAELFANWLCRQLDLPHHKVLFQIGGSFAVSAALALAQHVRSGRILSVAGAFHGLGLDSLSLALGQEEGRLFNTRLLRHVGIEVDVIAPGQQPSKWSDYSSFIYEPIQGSAGHVPLRLEWLADMERAARRFGVTVIADEILCGYFRHGWFSPARSNGLAPDIHLYSKSMTNGLYPYSAVVYSAEIEAALDDEICGEHTFQTSALGCRAAMAVADYLDRFDAAAAVARLDQCFAAALSDLGPGHRTTCTLTLHSSLDAATVAQRCFDRGVLVTISGENDRYICLVPPLTVEPERLADAINIVKHCLR
jgi:acetylornithine/succinyldiaminopimelate/putrescine aminotransferase